MRTAFATLAVLSITAGGAAAAQVRQDGTPAPPRPVLDTSIVGTSTCDREPCFGHVMRDAAVQRLLLRLAGGPVDTASAEAALSPDGPDADDLLALRLMRKEGDHYVLGFALFTAADVQRIRTVSDRLAGSLAAALLARRAEIEAALAAYDAPGVDRRDVAFFLLGCASLDWDGLAVTAEHGYRQTTAERPDGTYVPVAMERVDLSLRRIYWGSHNVRVDGIGLTSFGDHDALPRILFPDLIWRAPGFPDTVPDPPRAALDGLLKASFRRSAATVARTMLALRDGDGTADELASATGAGTDEIATDLDVLLGLGYVSETDGRFRARVPVLAERDDAMARQVLAIGRQVMEAWLAAHYDAIRDELADLSFTRAGVPFAEGFTMIWHYVFGMANQKLVEAGLFADPYAPDRAFRGAVPVVNALHL